MNENENMGMELIDDDDTPEVTAIDAFVVDNDQKADWCIRQIKARQEDTDRWKRFYAERAKAVEESNMFAIARLKQHLIPYIQQVPMKETKTRSKYGLPSGDLVLTKEHTKIEHDDDSLLEWLKQNAAEYVKTKEAVNWKDLKDHLKEIDGSYYLTDNGEKVPGVSSVLVPAEFDVKIKDKPGDPA